MAVSWDWLNAFLSGASAGGLFKASELQGAGKQNVIYNATTRRTTLIDFEQYEHATEHHRTLDASRMYGIFVDRELTGSAGG